MSTGGLGFEKIFISKHTKLSKNNYKPIEVCLSYPLSLPEISRVIVGVDSTEHLTEILRVRNSNAFDNSYYFMSSDDETLVNPSKWNVL